MKQYCRYCSYLVVGDFAYCEIKEKTMSEATAKSVNKCQSFELNTMDAFCENERGYQPRISKPNNKTKMQGQLTFDDIRRGDVI